VGSLTSRPHRPPWPVTGIVLLLLYCTLCYSCRTLSIISVPTSCKGGDDVRWGSDHSIPEFFAEPAELGILRVHWHVARGDDILAVLRDLSCVFLPVTDCVCRVGFVADSEHFLSPWASFRWAKTAQNLCHVLRLHIRFVTGTWNVGKHCTKNLHRYNEKFLRATAVSSLPGIYWFGTAETIFWLHCVSSDRSFYVRLCNVSQMMVVWPKHVVI
jgi:hypothetical protein